MTLVNSKKVFRNAIDNHYAVGAFNFINFETLSSILTSASECKSPVIIQSSTGAVKYMGLKALHGMVYAMAEDLDIDVIWNLDHGKTFEDCKNAVDAGFTNVMIDASLLPYEENIALTKKVVEYAHLRNVTVEAELGVLAGVEDEHSASDSDAFYTNPKDAYDFVKRTNVDSLAIAIGTSHGTHKFSGNANLRIDVLKKIEELLPDFPLVLHGASSIPKEYVALAEKYGAKLGGANGVPESMLKEVCTHNICKINVDSDLRLGFTAGIRQFFSENPSEVDMRKYNNVGMKNIKDIVKNKIENVFLSSNKCQNIDNQR